MSSWPGRSSSGYGSRQASPVLVARQELIMSVRMTSESCASVTVTGPANGAVTVIFLKEALKRYTLGFEPIGPNFARNMPPTLSEQRMRAPAVVHEAYTCVTSRVRES